MLTVHFYNHAPIILETVQDINLATDEHRAEYLFNPNHYSIDKGESFTTVIDRLETVMGVN